MGRFAADEQRLEVDRRDPVGGGSPPLIVVACRDPGISRGIVRELRREFGTRGFDTVSAESPDAAWELIAAADRDGTDVAMALAGAEP